ncbi:PCC domain-containing protein [Rhodopila sp.]|uniref:PCC domain-containing protein n=1 Tax=Rhodopila sp. TaxID=2480087 RepID=UPI003D0CA939
MRQLMQPGPVHPKRIDSIPGKPHRLHFALTPGATLNAALTAPLVAAGFQSATVTFQAADLDPFHYVVPSPANDAFHVAWFSAPRAPIGTCRIERANATFGWVNGKPFVHCHAVWSEPDGRRRGGHILPHETILAATAEATGWGFMNVRIEAAADAETNFPLFQPSGIPLRDASGIVARIKPNQDILTAIETIASTYRVADAVVRGSLGSLIGARFAGGGQVDDHATEVLVREGCICNGQAALDMLVVDMRGMVHEGWLQHGQNPVCITFEVVLEAVAPPAG